MSWPKHPWRFETPILISMMERRAMAENKVASRNVGVLREWLERPARQDAKRSIDMRFFSRRSVSTAVTVSSG